MSTSIKQILNTRISTETELVAADDLMPHLYWTSYFLECQGYNVHSTIMYQDNQSAILLDNNGRASSSKRTKHLNIRFLLITNWIKKGDLRIEYCPTDNIVANFFTKPLQGKKLIQFIKLIMNLQDWNIPWPKECVGNQLVSFYLNIFQCLDSIHTYFLFYFECTNGLFAVQDWLFYLHCSKNVWNTKSKTT